MAATRRERVGDVRGMAGGSVRFFSKCKVYAMSDKYLVEYQLEDGSTILIESEDKHGIERISDKDNTSKASEKFESAVKHIKPVAKALFGAFEEFNNPQEIQLEFGVKFSAKAGVIFASADSEATFKVSLKWQNK